MQFPAKEVDDGVRLAQDTSNRFPDDQLLREAKWEIRDRPERGPAIWKHRHHKAALTTAEAVEEIKAYQQRLRKGGLLTA